MECTQANSNSNTSFSPFFSVLALPLSLSPSSSLWKDEAYTFILHSPPEFVVTFPTPTCTSYRSRLCFSDWYTCGRWQSDDCGRPGYQWTGGRTRVKLDMQGRNRLVRRDVGGGCVFTSLQLRLHMILVLFWGCTLAVHQHKCFPLLILLGHRLAFQSTGLYIQAISLDSPGTSRRDLHRNMW